MVVTSVGDANTTYASVDNGTTAMYDDVTGIDATNQTAQEPTDGREYDGNC